MTTTKVELTELQIVEEELAANPTGHLDGFREFYAKGMEETGEVWVRVSSGHVCYRCEECEGSGIEEEATNWYPAQFCSACKGHGATMWRIPGDVAKRVRARLKAQTGGSDDEG